MNMTCFSCGAPLVDDDQRYCECEYCGTLNKNLARHARVQEQIDLERARNAKYNVTLGNVNHIAIGDNATVLKVAMGNNIFQS